MEKYVQCAGRTAKKTRCTRSVPIEEGCCWQHKNQPQCKQIARAPAPARVVPAVTKAPSPKLPAVTKAPIPKPPTPKPPAPKSPVSPPIKPELQVISGTHPISLLTGTPI